ncbi:MAG: glutamate-5-semialdehyde dehydrogenase [Candidatus Omnitrophota bacterium]|jgi:glutamate-5-semialdehyde dehydrogenase|nr:MAG: glutamate-5-semialdehyde dehydrogenase [Candidatus Omnitrophota bacterium]
MDSKKEIKRMASEARLAASALVNLSSEKKNKIIKDMALALIRFKAEIINGNKKDISAARKMKLGAAFIDRLILSDKRIADMSDSLLEISKLSDPIGEVIKAWRRPNGLWIHKVRVPIGVIAIIYESRPNVTSDCIGLCFKSGNSVILKGGSESLYSNLAIFKVLNKVLLANHIPKGAANLLEFKHRKAVDYLLALNNDIDLVIPRGGQGLINRVTEISKIPVIKHYKGICHVYVDEWADLNMAESICFNAKVQRPGVCNAMESMLVHKDAAVRFLPSMLKKLRASGVQIRGCPITLKIVKGLRKATEKDYRTEYLDLVLSVKVVNDVKAAIDHINNYGSHHSDSIVTENYDNAMEFLKQVDSACVYVNASTRFTDGYQFGMGAEIGISTDKLHARGPMALEELTTYKYMVFGNGQIRQ